MKPSIYARASRPTRKTRLAAICTGVIAISMVAASCQTFSIVRNHGYIQSQEMIEQVPEGSSQEHVQLVLGTPSTTATFGNEVYYYISQRTETIAFLEPRIVDQRVLAVYFDEDRTVSRIANYGIEDGRMIDFIGRRTPTTGEEVTFLRQIFSAAVGEEI
jgi:outer membrane protein assembly factor BamE (lipoprotein component of BamABCDE complex)